MQRRGVLLIAHTAKELDGAVPCRGLDAMTAITGFSGEALHALAVDGKLKRPGFDAASL